MSEYLHVHAIRWSKGWELHIADVGVTQSARLAGAERMIRSYLGMVGLSPEVPFVVQYEIEGVAEEEIQLARAAIDEAASAQRAAAERSRATVRHLLGAGLNQSDVAEVMGISPQRVSQLKS